MPTSSYLRRCQPDSAALRTAAREKLRKAREWFSANFHAAGVEDMQRIAPPGTQENAYFRMVGELLGNGGRAGDRGVLNQDLFFQTNGELLFVWERVRELLRPIGDVEEPELVAKIWRLSAALS